MWYYFVNRSRKLTTSFQNIDKHYTNKHDFTFFYKNVKL